MTATNEFNPSTEVCSEQHQLHGITQFHLQNHHSQGEIRLNGRTSNGHIACGGFFFNNSCIYPEMHILRQPTKFQQNENISKKCCIS